MIRQVKTNSTIYTLADTPLGRGETAIVYPAYPANNNSSHPHYAVKLAKNKRHNHYIEQEYKTITLLHSKSTAKKHLPLPTVEKGQEIKQTLNQKSNEHRQALVMQKLDQPLLKTIENLNNPLQQSQLAIKAAQQYAILLQTLIQANLSCQDKKLGDLWWVGSIETGQLIVTDWNVINKTANPQADIRRFGLLWYELLMGHQMRAEFPPLRTDFNNVKHKISYGWWYIIAQAVGDSMGPQFETIEALSTALTELQNSYNLSPSLLTQKANTHLEKAKQTLNHKEADLAWLKFDMATRLNTKQQTPSLETSLIEAQQWAINPIKQAAHNLLNILVSPFFSKAKEALTTLNNKAQNPQEKSDIKRLWYCFNLLNYSQRILIQHGENGQKEFLKVQTMLIKEILPALTVKDGKTATQHLETLKQLLQPYHKKNNTEPLKSLQNEANFWESYQNAQEQLQSKPHLAVKALKKAKQLRQSIDYWEALYHPTLQTIKTLQNKAIINYKHTALQPKQSSTLAQKDITALLISVQEDLAQRRWEEAVASLITEINRYPNNTSLINQLKEVITQLMKTKAELKQYPQSLKYLIERATIIKAIQQALSYIVPKTSPSIKLEQELEQELKQIEILNHTILEARRNLFKNPSLVLEQALQEKYELFDSSALAVAVLKTVYDAGLWNTHEIKQKATTLESDNQKLSKHIEQLNQKAINIAYKIETYQQTTQNIEQSITLWKQHQAEIKNFLTNNKQWQEKTEADLKTLPLSILKLLLSIIPIHLQQGEDVKHLLNKAEQLLTQKSIFSSIAEQEKYKSIYNDLYTIQKALKKSSKGLISPAPNNTLTEKLEALFKAKKFDDCFKHLQALSTNDKNMWYTRLEKAKYLHQFITSGKQYSNSQPKQKDLSFTDKLIDAVKRLLHGNNNTIQACEILLKTLQNTPQTIDKMTYDLFETDMSQLYKRTRNKLRTLDSNGVNNFPTELTNKTTLKTTFNANAHSTISDNELAAKIAFLKANNKEVENTLLSTNKLPNYLLTVSIILLLALIIGMGFWLKNLNNEIDTLKQTQIEQLQTEQPFAQAPSTLQATFEQRITNLETQIATTPHNLTPNPTPVEAQTTPTPTTPPTTMPTKASVNAPLPTNTPTNTATPIPYGTVNTEAYLRSGPGINYDIIGFLNIGEQLKIISQLNNQSWFQIETINKDKSGWVSAQYVTLDSELMRQNIPIAQETPIPPPPTATEILR